METYLAFGREFQYLALFSSVLILPKMLLRFGIPSGITSLVLGCLCVNFLGWFESDQLVLMLARLGITSLFLFAGMEIEIEELKSNLKPLLIYIGKSLLIMIGAALVSIYVLNVSFQVALIISVALFTPSAGFILSSLRNYELSEQEVFWIKLKAISKEVAAIIVLFIALQLNDIESLFITKAIFIGLFFLIPIIVQFFLKFVAPFAPKSEVSFLVILAFMAGVLTKKLGTHYLVGAFMTGIIAGQFKHFIASEDSDRILESLSMFFYIFVPFYFFKAGLIITEELFIVKGLLLGIGLAVIVIPIRVFSVRYNIKNYVKDFWEDRDKIAMALTPNLIFGLVIVNILKESFNIDTYILTALIFYTLASSLLPALYFKRVPPEDFDLSKV